MNVIKMYISIARHQTTCSHFLFLITVCAIYRVNARPTCMCTKPLYIVTYELPPVLHILCYFWIIEVLENTFSMMITGLPIFVFVFLIYCEVICIPWTFNFVYFVGRPIHKFKIPTKYFYSLINIKTNLKSTNSNVHEHVNCLMSTKVCAHEIKWFHSSSCNPISRVMCYSPWSPVELVSSLSY